MNNKLSILIWCSIIEAYLEIAAREYSNALSAFVLAQINSFHKFSFDHNIADELHLEFAYQLRVDSFAILVLTVSCSFNFDEAWHSFIVSSLDISHHAIETFKVIDFASRHDIVRLVTFALDANLLPDQCDTIKLNSRHHLFRLLF